MSAPEDAVGRLAFTVDGEAVTVADRGVSLLEVLREDLGRRSAKDGCSPQGQCGCCTVLVDGAPRVACVTPARRVAGRAVTTEEGLAPEVREEWSGAFAATGASQCGFCTPGIVVRLEGLRRRGDLTPPAVERALLAHLCRCTGWRTILDASALVAGGPEVAAVASAAAGRDLDAAARRAQLEGGRPQAVGPAVARGEGGFAADTVPSGALVAVPSAVEPGGWAVGETLAEARAAAGKVQGRRTTVPAAPPLEVPPGAWDLTLRTSWVEPAYLETDASWCAPDGEPVSPLANGGAFGGKEASPASGAARRLARELGRPVVALLSREDTVRLGPKRPPIAAGVRLDGTGIVHVVRTPGVVERIAAVAPSWTVVELDAIGPPTSVALRGAGWAEAAVLSAAVAARAAGRDHAVVRGPHGGTARASVTTEGAIAVALWCGEPLDEIVLRSYAIGAAHMAVGWVTSEGLSVDEQGDPRDLTIRSFGVPRAVDMPSVEVTIGGDDVRDGDDDLAEPVNGSDAVFAAVAAAVWLHQGCPPVWPTGLALRR